MKTNWRQKHFFQPIISKLWYSILKKLVYECIKLFNTPCISVFVSPLYRVKSEEDKLYELPSHLQVESQKSSEEMLSNQMLSGIPEVDLGIQWVWVYRKNFENIWENWNGIFENW